MKVFIIGPGGVGKSTSGKILASKLGYELVDLDIEFMNQVGHIGSFIDNYGYENYAKRNSDLFYKLLNAEKDHVVFVLSSGFLVHKGLEKLTVKHYKTLQKNGISILLLPSSDIRESVEIIVARQLSRDFGLREANERKKFMERFSKYLEFGDIKIYSHGEPEQIAEEMKNRLANRLAVV